jgi:PTH1 family peptidyl-tRNA hydrolase
MSDSSSWLLVGLGNPGREYAGNRHNVGFMAVEQWLAHKTLASGGPAWRDKFHGRIASTPTGPHRTHVLEPQTYMNRSGQSVAAAARFHQVPPARIVVVHDELDFPFARLALKQGGGHGGHNGLRDIIATLGSPEFVRIRVGIGRPTRGDVSRWVLSDFDASDRAELPTLLDRVETAIDALQRDGLVAAMNVVNVEPPR